VKRGGGGEAGGRAKQISRSGREWRNKTSQHRMSRNSPLPLFLTRDSLLNEIIIIIILIIIIIIIILIKY